ncbi:MAG: M48 family metallopeptidase [Candidatus Omnitrophica bacterium]|nr:M48 family metallopeptidase [Candidatus Omnitrophota bacterium]
MQIVIQPSREIVVSVPTRYSESQIKDFLVRKSAWILRKLKALKDSAQEYAKDTKSQKGCFYLGKFFPLQYFQTDTKWGKIDFEEEKLSVYIPRRVAAQDQAFYVREFLLKWFKARATVVLNERISQYSTRMGVVPAEVHIRSARRLWGSCHPVKRILHFNWKVLMAPLDTLDYVVVHELCHIKVPNHSREFWDLVRKYAGDFKRHHAWLRSNGHRLVLP